MDMGLGEGGLHLKCTKPNASEQQESEPVWVHISVVVIISRGKKSERQVVIVEIIELEHGWLIEMSSHGEMLGPFTTKELEALLEALREWEEEGGF